MLKCIAFSISCKGEASMKKQYNFRIEEDLLYKLNIIARENERTATQEITLLIRKYILKYELEHGKIDTPED